MTEACATNRHAVVEEELAPCFAALWRWHRGWRPDLLGLRGPGVVPGIIHSFTGFWRFCREPIRLVDLPAGALLGGVVRRIDPTLGSYGMGGPGYLGFKVVSTKSAGTIWVIVALWAANTRGTIDGALITEGHVFDDRSELARTGYNRFVNLDVLRGSTVMNHCCSDDRFEMRFERGREEYHLEFRSDGAGLPLWRGSKTPKSLAPDESMKDMIIVSRRGNLWLS